MLNLIEYTKKYKTEWDDFVDNSWNGTLFHKQEFLEYHGNRFKDLSFLLLNKNDNIVSVFPAAKKENSLWSHPGASFGGPVLKGSRIDELLCVVENIENYAKEKKLDSVSMVLTPNLFHLYPTEGIEFALFYRGFKATAIELSICVPLNVKNFSNRRCRGVITALKNEIVIKESTDFKNFWGVLSTNLRIRYSATPTHSLKEILYLKNKFPEDVKLFAAYHHNVMIAGVLVIINNETSFETFYIAQNYNFTKLRALDLLLLKIHEWGHNNGFKYMNFGITSENRGKNINFGLAKFKEEFGGLDITRRIYSKEIS